jgi:hypothetical protein
VADAVDEVGLWEAAEEGSAFARGRGGDAIQGVQLEGKIGSNGTHVGDEVTAEDDGDVVSSESSDFLGCRVFFEAASHEEGIWRPDVVLEVR